ncbi:hypothetical protein [Ottowia sp.]|uniref:hypothetical protein n=1 Tax=Ottowia sp. TaxID=1898956 RepID=UPI0025EDCF36|nr:hypothetical protein [Ottowia sp.]MBK6616638.1 hypothetical protein [Ottowia sp.]
MVQIQETGKFVVFSEDCGTRVRIEKKEDGLAVILLNDDARDMLEKLRDAANDAVRDYWIDAWSNHFTRPVDRPFENILAPTARRQPHYRRR